MITDYIQKDRALVEELGLRHIARVVGYDSFGSPIELVFDADTNTYDWHIAGERVKEASSAIVLRILRQEVLCLTVK